MSARIDLEDVGQVFQVRDDADRSRREFVALESVDLAIEAGEFVTLVGPSGCGKSTILDLVSGLAEPTYGTVSINGRRITGPGHDRSIVFQQYTLLPWRTAQGNVELALEAKGGMSKTERARTALEYLRLVGLEEFAQRLPGELSGGMMQRVAIARSLSCKPEVLLMDEPFGALDAQTRERLQEELLGIWKRTGTTVLFITHDIDEAIFLGQRVAVMSAHPGRIREVVDIHLDRSSADQEEDPRGTQAFARYRHRVWTLLRERPARPRHEEVASVA
ncbi:ABC transporter ATP-binding protein [Nocardioides sp.]|jgi:NitT/TauT family transport system ATP-binding protein|uniref:ABC transporter ATP-binding protein n=1 Tax=Nocardioides sp. TaxID=35761 RepID=UPI002F3E51F0